MNQINKECELQAEIKRVTRIIQTTESPYLRQDMAKYLKRLEKALRYGITKGPRAPL